VAGVCWVKRDEWQASIQRNLGWGQLMYLGVFPSEELAALAYDQAARLYHGNKAQLNFPDLPPQLALISHEGLPASPPSQPAPGQEPMPHKSLALADCLPGDAPGERDYGPGQTPPKEPGGEPEGPCAHKDATLDRDPTNPGAPPQSQYRGEPKRT
jgi:hypothetical protein